MLLAMLLMLDSSLTPMVPLFPSMNLLWLLPVLITWQLMDSSTKCYLF